jgi:hypothetical protein
MTLEELKDSQDHIISSHVLHKVVGEGRVRVWWNKASWDMAELVGALVHRHRASIHRDDSSMSMPKPLERSEEVLIFRGFSEDDDVISRYRR